MNRKILVFLLFSVLIVSPILAQDVLFDDANNCHHRGIWIYLLDTLSAHGANLHYVADEGWTNLMDMDMVWLECPTAYYSPTVKAQLQNFSRNGGKIVMGDVNSPEILNDLLTDPGWQTTMEILDASTSEMISHFYPFPPFTDGVTSLDLSWPRVISCGDNSYPFAFGDAYYSQPVAAISYPFVHEDNCSTFIVLVMGTHSWETYHSVVGSNYRFASNILLCAAGIEGFEIDGCASPEGIIEIISIPDCANPGETVRIEGTNIYADIIVHIGGENIVPTAYGIDSTWLEFICPDLPQGIFTLQLERDAFRFYAGQLQVYCDWIDLASLTQGCFEIDDTVYFTGSGFTPGEMALQIECPFDTVLIIDFEIVTQDSGWLLVPEVDTVNCSYFFVRLTNTTMGNYDRHYIQIPCPCPGMEDMYVENLFSPKAGDTRNPVVDISPIDTCVFVGEMIDINWVTSADSFMSTPEWLTREPIQPIDFTVQSTDDSYSFGTLANIGDYPWVVGDNASYDIAIVATDWFGNYGDTTISICTQVGTATLSGYALSPPCDPDSMIFIIHHEEPIDNSTIAMGYDGFIYTYPNLMHWADETTLVFIIPEHTPGSHIVGLGRICDTDDNCIDEIERGFTLDFDPPVIISFLDTTIAAIEGTTITVTYIITDSLAGVDWDNVIVTANDDSLQFTISGDTIQVSLDSISAGSLFVCVNAQDNPYPPCPPNLSSICDTVIVYPGIPDYSCSSVPNPFTPNDDNINDYMQFTFPGLGKTDGAIYIYDIHGHEVRHIDIPAGRFEKIKSRWDGKDNSEKFLPQGLYIYVIEVSREVVCEGTAVIAR